MQRIDLTGKTFGDWTVLTPHFETGKALRWWCRCSCGREKLIYGASLRAGDSKMCEDCRKSRGGNRRHGAFYTSTYKIWAGMIGRCECSNTRLWHRYGGRGIKVCDRWRHSFENFKADMGERPEGMQLDRIDNDGNYEPSNCRWTTRSKNCQNTRRNRRVEWRGETLAISEWARRTGLLPSRIHTRLKAGWSVEAAMTIPPHCRNNKGKFKVA